MVEARARTDELKTFIKERQEELKAERICVEAVELQKLQLEQAEHDAKLIAEKEAEERPIAAEERRLAAEKEADERPITAEERLIAADKEKEERDLKRLELESQKKIGLKELEIRLAQENRRPEEVRVISGQ